MGDIVGGGRYYQVGIEATEQPQMG